VQMIWIPFWAAGFVNGIGHWAGYRNFETSDTSRNLIPWGFWIGGEELHNNHHAFPSSAKFALRKWEFDIGWLSICALRKLGLAKVLRVAPSLDVLPNVPLPDADTLKAVLTHRFQALSDFYRRVIVPCGGGSRERAGGGALPGPGGVGGALPAGGRGRNAGGRGGPGGVRTRPPSARAVCVSRTRLSTLLDQRGAAQARKGLQQWISEAEASGIRSLQDFAARLKGYTLAGAPAAA